MVRRIYRSFTSWCESLLVKTVQLISTCVVLIAILSVAASCGQSKTVTVPDVEGACYINAYDVLHGAGLRVSSGELNGKVVQENPPGGTLVRGGVVTLAFGRITAFGFMCADYYRNVAMGSVAMGEKAPDLVGKTLDFAYKERARGVYIEVRNSALPPLHDADGSNFYDNYIVTRQSPAAGTLLPEQSASNPPGTTNVTVRVTAAS